MPNVCLLPQPKKQKKEKKEKKEKPAAADGEAGEGEGEATGSVDSSWQCGSCGQRNCCIFTNAYMRGPWLASCIVRRIVVASGDEERGPPWHQLTLCDLHAVQL
jgi:hypothetical protein